MNLVSSPALRPSHPHVCRKRAFRQGQALSGRFAGLDLHALTSGLGYSRVTAEDACGAGSAKGYLLPGIPTCNIWEYDSTSCRIQIKAVQDTTRRLC